MQIYLARNNQQAGPYTVEQLNQMLSSQQVLLTDLAWHQGMPEWKTLGELTQGQMIFRPQGYVAPQPSAAVSTSNAQPNKSLEKSIKISKDANNAQLASLGSRFVAKILDLLLWIPAVVIPSFFLNESQIIQLVEIQKKMQNATTSDQVLQLQEQFFSLVPDQAWLAMAVYILVMLAVQAVLLTKTGQSLGKRIAKIQIVDASTGQPVNLMRAFTLRSLIFITLNIIITPVISLIDFLFGIGPKRQTLHDKLSKTKVIKR